jgi:stearoyl-CoA desaturase (delta-9 desaturase)
VYCRHLLKDPIVVFVNRTFLLWIALSFVILYLIGGWTGILWGGLVRIFLWHHLTFSVNSVCHTFGKRAFETNDRSRNEWIVGLLAFGEGWHNNHHAFPRSAFHGLHWWQFDLSGYIIWMLERLGLAHDVYRVSPALLARYSSRNAGPTLGASDPEAI